MSSTLVGGPVANEAANIQPEPGRNEVVDKPVGDTAIVSVKNDTKLLPESLTPSATGAAQEVNVGPTSADTVTASETRAHVEREEQATKEVQVSAAAYNRSNSGPESSSQASAEANVNAQTQSADANTENGSANDGGMVMQAVEEQASTRHDSRPNYVVSQATTTSNMANSAESSSRIVEEITQAPPPMSYSRRRVKVYALNSSGNWFDRGTGMVDIRGWDTDVRDFLPLFSIYRWPFYVIDDPYGLPYSSHELKSRGEARARPFLRPSLFAWPIPLLFRPSFLPLCNIGMYFHLSLLPIAHFDLLTLIRWRRLHSFALD